MMKYHHRSGRRIHFLSVSDFILDRNSFGNCFGSVSVSNEKRKCFPKFFSTRLWRLFRSSFQDVSTCCRREFVAGLVNWRRRRRRRRWRPNVPWGGSSRSSASLSSSSSWSPSSSRSWGRRRSSTRCTSRSAGKQGQWVDPRPSDTSLRKSQEPKRLEVRFDLPISCFEHWALESTESHKLVASNL